MIGKKKKPGFTPFDSTGLPRWRPRCLRRWRTPRGTAVSSSVLRFFGSARSAAPTDSFGMMAQWFTNKFRHRGGHPHFDQIHPSLLFGVARDPRYGACGEGTFFVNHSRGNAPASSPSLPPPIAPWGTNPSILVFVNDLVRGACRLTVSSRKWFVHSVQARAGRGRIEEVPRAVSRLEPLPKRCDVVGYVLPSFLPSSVY